MFFAIRFLDGEYCILVLSENSTNTEGSECIALGPSALGQYTQTPWVNLFVAQVPSFGYTFLPTSWKILVLLCGQQYSL